MSSLSEEGGRWSARPRILRPPRLLPLLLLLLLLLFRRWLTTELMLVIMLGSMPRTVQDEESRVRVDGREGQSPMRWRLLVQWAQERETRTGSESGRVVVSFHIRSQSSSMCVVEPHSSQGNSLEEPFSADGQLSSA